MIVVGYCRYSSEGQRDGYSIEAQTRAITDYCQKEGHTIARMFVDEAQTGTDDDRESFLDMINAVKDHQFEAIIVHKLDRFARNRYDSAVYGKILEKEEVKLVSVLEPMASDDSPEAFLFKGMIETYNEFYSKNLGREVLKGKREAALLGKHLGGPVPYGFMLDKDNRYTPHPDEAPIVFEIFAKLDSGHTPSEVARWLVSKDVRTRYDLPYSPEAVVKMTENAVYMGRYTWGTRSKRKNSTPVVIDNAFPAIVSPDVFMRVYDATISRKRGPMKRMKEVDYFLTGYLFCEYCGEHLYGFKSRTYYYKKEYPDGRKEYVTRKYRCSNRKKSDKNRRFEPDFNHKPCTLEMFKKEELEDFIFESIKENVFTDATINFVVKSLTERLKNRTPGSASDIKKTETAIKAISVKIERLLDLYLDGSMDKAVYLEKRTALSKQLDTLTKELDALSFKPTAVSADAMKKAALAFSKSAPSDKEEYMRLLLATFVDHIDVSNEHIVIYYKLGLPGLPDSSQSDFVRKQTSVSICLVCGNIS